MSEYEFDDDDRYEDDDDDRKDHHDDDVIPTPTPTPAESIVRVVINQPEVNITNNATIVERSTTINTVIENVIVNPPVPVPPAPHPTTNYIYGTRNNDYLTGTDLNDVIYGYQGNDTLIDGLGADKLYGAKGKNTYYCTADGQTDFIYVKRDKKADVIKSVGIEDRIDVKGSKFIFSKTELDVQIFYKNSLEVIYTGSKLSLSEIKTITV